MASVSDIVQGTEMTVVGAVAGSVAGAVAEKLGDYLIDQLNIPTGPKTTITQAGLDVIVRSASAAVVFMVMDQAVEVVRRGRTDPTGGMFFSFIFVQSQPELLAAASRFGGLIKTKLG